MRLAIPVLVLIASWPVFFAGQEGAVTWFKFDEHFIEARYPAAVAFGG